MTETFRAMHRPGDPFVIPNPWDLGSAAMLKGLGFAALATTATEVLRGLGGVEILGPGIIDFEPHALAAALNYPGTPSFDIVSGLLYVDRRGAPENRQLGFDALGKAAMMRSIGPPGANWTMANATSRIPRMVGIMSSRRLMI